MSESTAVRRHGGGTDRLIGAQGPFPRPHAIERVRRVQREEHVVTEVPTHTSRGLRAHIGLRRHVPRSFARHFQHTTGVAPLRRLITQRVTAAQKLLERTDLPLPEVPRRTGFGSDITVRRHFADQLSTSPRDYRRAFQGADGPADG